MNKSILLLGALVVGAASVSVGAANAAVIDNINGNFLPPFLVFADAVQNILGRRRKAPFQGAVFRGRVRGGSGFEGRLSLG